jgi:exodeoxyribonuclease-5
METLSEEQASAVREVRNLFRDGRQEVTLGGLAGTGKTTIAKELPRIFKLRQQEIAYCAFTGKAAAVLNKKLGARVATTIHGLIYMRIELHCEKCPRFEDSEARCHSHTCPRCITEWERKPVLEPEIKLIVVDEASMINETIHDDLASYGVRILWIGDHGQLPPISGSLNLMNEPDVRLEAIHRQAADSPIIKLAMLARETGKIPYGEFGPGVNKRRSDGAFEWTNGTLALCGRNKTRVSLNRSVRANLELNPAHPEPGDRLICLRNNKYAGIYNGMTGRLAEIEFNKGTYLVTVEIDGGGEYSGRCLPEQFGAERTLSEVPRNTDLWDFGYVLTVHKAQGSESDRVLLFEEPFGTWDERRRWLYTAITRAKQELEIIA